MKLKIGITDYVPSPFSVERQALGDACELVNLNVHSAEDFAEKDVSDLDALLVWHAPITNSVVNLLKSCRIIVR